jgi:GT2 family glycosyltransferase
VSRLAVIVPATDAPPTLERCLAAIAAADESPDEVIVVDSPELTNPALARNAGVARSTAEVVVFVDSDVAVAPDAFTRIREHFARDHGLTAVFGAYDDVVATHALAARFRNLLHHHVHARSAGQASTFWAGLGAIRRSAFELADGFDGQRPTSIEDVELGLRLSDIGARIILDPDIRGTHLKEWSFWQMVTTDFSRRGIPWVHLLLDRREVPATLNLGWRERASALTAVASAILLVGRRPIAASAAAALLVPINRPFYDVLVRRLGRGPAIACVPLHVAHHLAASAAVPAGLVTYALGRKVPTRPAVARDPAPARAR